MKKMILPAVLAVFEVAVPSAASACTVCFGGADSKLIDGFFWGVLLLLILPISIAGVFFVAIVRASKKRKAQ